MTLNQSLLKRHSRGLIPIASILILVAALSAIVLFKSVADQREHSTRQGVGIVRILTEMPFSDLTSQHTRTNLLSSLRYSVDEHRFAYIAITDQQGTTVQSVAGEGIFVPDRPLPLRPSDWYGSAELPANDKHPNITEYYGPILGDDGELRGFVRLGLKTPTVGFNNEQLAFIGALSLPICLLIPLFYLPLQRQTRMFESIGERLDANADMKTLQIEASGDLKQFIDRLNRLIETTQSRVLTMEAEQSELEMSGKLLGYQRDRVEQLLQSLPEGCISLDDVGQVNFINNRAQSLFGCDQAMAISSPLQDWCNKPEVTRFIQAFTGKSAAMNYSHRVIFESDFEPNRTQEVRGYPLFSLREDHRIVGTLIVIRDITEQQALRRQRSEFVAHIAHELKTPLNVLSLYSETLQDQGDEPEFRTEAVNVISDEVERLSTLINNLLRLTEFEMGTVKMERRPTRFLDLLNDTVDTISRDAKARNLHIRKQWPPEFSTLYLDKELMRMALTNLISNAIKYNRENGEIRIIAIEDDDMIRIQISDTGIGVNDEDRPRIFDKFYRSDSEAVRKRSGHGLGLPLVKEIVEMHHGKVSVDSRSGEGSDFIIEFDKQCGILSQTL